MNALHQCRAFIPGVYASTAERVKMSFFRNWFLLFAAITLTSCTASEEERCLDYCTDEARAALQQAEEHLDRAQAVYQRAEEHETRTANAVENVLERARQHELQTREVLRLSEERLSELRELRALECLPAPGPQVAEVPH